MMGNGDLNHNEEDAKSYALSGKILLSAIVILFFIVILMICLHLYVRCFHLRARRRQRRRHRSHVVSHLVFYDESGPATALASTRGLDSSLLMSLPVFVYSSKTHTEQVECPVCLSEFEEGETGRLLPKCNHSFHADCIDMWFKSHSTCPTCRAAVEPAPAYANRPEVVITVIDEPEIPEPGSTSGLCSVCQDEGRDEVRSGCTVCSSSSSIELGRKPSSLAGVTLEVPKRSESFGAESPSTQSPFRSPMSRMLSFKRMLSRDRKANLSPSAGGSGSGSEIEKDGGGGEETQ